MLRRYARSTLAALAVAFLSFASMPAALAHADTSAACLSNGSAFGSELAADINLGFVAQLPTTVSTTSAASTLSGFPNWGFLLSNASGVPVSNPLITVNSGYSAAVFGDSLPPPGFPSSCGQPTLASGQTIQFPELEGNSLPTTFSLGFDSTRSVSPQTVPVGGGQQTVTVTATLQDQRYGAGNQLQVAIGLGTGDTVVSTTSPSNLGQGEFLTANPSQALWTIGQAVLAKQYTFSAVINYANPFDYAWTHFPGVDVNAAAFNGDCSPCGIAGPTVTLPVPSLDGGTQGAGAVTFSVAETGHTWTGGTGFVYLAQYLASPGDTTPPVITVPGPIIVDATSPAGAVVNYVVSATDPDNLSSPLPVICSPVSGSTFTIGVTTVYCNASDPSGNTANASFTVKVLGANAQLNNLIATSQGMDLANGISTSLDAKLNAAIATLADMKTNSISTACNQLSAFINDTTAQSGNKLTASQANELIAAAQKIRAILSC